MKKIAVVHYQPLEYYPPVMNFLDIAALNDNQKLEVWTTHNIKKRKVYGEGKFGNLFRAELPKEVDNSIVRFFKYLGFNLKCLLGLLRYKPDKILYFESYSVWPVYIYLHFFNSKPELFIHYHEYFGPNWYKNGMRLLKIYHKWEQNFLYKKAIWISQTNEDRVRLFLVDNPKLDSSKMKILPNYPPSSWHRDRVRKKLELPLKTVYIGTLTLEHSYLKQYCEWVVSQNGNVLFDIYGFNYDSKTLEYLKNIDSPYIMFFEGGINYQEIPVTLNNYDLGLILYTAEDDNFKYNASNKLFEYLACGLQVWYSDKMLGIQPYRCSNVVGVNFENIGSFDYENVLKSNEKENSKVHTAEEALQPLLKQLEK